jgi:predicted Zn finger-like uncharacterized protein
MGHDDRFVTRCPECLSAFVATDQQLGLAAGQVRCGHCGARFDAHAHRMLPPARASEPAPPPPADIGAPAPAGNADFRHWPARRSSGLRGALVVTLLVLLAGACVTAFLLRDAAARALPAWRPWILTACQQLGCPLAPLLELDALSIESSELRNDAGALTLVVTLRNRLDYPVGAPAITVSVANQAGVLLTRDRVAPHRYLGDRAELLAGIGAGAQLELSVRLSGTWPAAANFQMQLGYR